MVSARGRAHASWLGQAFGLEVQRFMGLVEMMSENHSGVSDFLGPHGLYSPWNSPGQNIGVGSLSLLQGIFPT